METPRTFIIIKNEPKALQIEKFYLGDNNVYNVKFKSSPKTFHYRINDVIWIKESIWHDHLHCKVFIAGKEQKNVADIRSFQYNKLTHWRITYNNGYVQDYLHGKIEVIESCLADEIAKNSFEYLKRVAQINELGKDEENGGILSSIYQNIDFIDKSLAVAPYLNPNKNKVQHMKKSSLIFPFGCNASQEKAVTSAFENQLSVIQGPPGTGKTQTILNIIANIITQGKTVMIVSNNNSATINVLEKLQKYGFGFIVASLGKKENKESFINNQTNIPNDLINWKLNIGNDIKKNIEISSTLSKLRKVFSLQEELAQLKLESKDIDIEWNHFKNDYEIIQSKYSIKRGLKSQKIFSLWLQLQDFIDNNVRKGFFQKTIEKLKLIRINLIFKYQLDIHSTDLQTQIQELQTLYYIVKIKELNNRISKIESELSSYDANLLNKKLVSLSMELLKNSLYNKYHTHERTIFSDIKDIRQKSDELLKQYPVILSTTFSARISLSDTIIYDYLIMDEASQVSVETGALALSCAKNAVIVGDTLQLPNVVTYEDKLKLDTIFKEYKVAKGYNSSDYSFLQSICTIIPNIQQTLLREHYRCHPKIINFCNQKFYGGKLLIMTEDNNEDNVMFAIKTVPGNHCRDHYNQREIDVVLQEVLPKLSNSKDIGIITPYNSQVEEFNHQIPSIETATIHKYQGREKDTIIMSLVDDQISEFSDDPNLLNVAISRAKKQFCLVLSGNEQKLKGNISELVDYISYNNFLVTDSKISSVFDYLYSHYTKQRIEFLANSKKVSEYESENLTYKLLTNIIEEIPEFSHLGILCHTSIRNILRDWSLMSDEEKKYISHYSTHIDFLIINHVTKKPLLAIETDGYNYHNNETEQYHRDMMKNHILEVYGLPLLRLSTIGSGEHDKIVSSLKKLIILK